MMRWVRFIFIFLISLLSASGETENGLPSVEKMPANRNLASEILETEKQMSNSATPENEKEMEKAFQVEQSLIDKNKSNEVE